MELLAPAGNFEKFEMALHYGADAIYFAGQSFGLRAFAGNFSNEEILKASKMAHEKNRKVYVTINIIARDKDFVGLKEYLDFLVQAKVDGVIVADLGVISYIRKNAPTLNVHVSTQANVINSYTANLLANMGVTRIVLARELSLEEIKEIRKNIPEHIELEAFVHGAMCISYSGRCLLSNYLTGRDSNRGECVQACRWKYFIREVSREDELEIQEDEKGSYILNSKDLNMLSHIKELQEAGVVSLKIEGRMKSSYYVATVVNAYRKAIDMLPEVAGKDLIEELEKTSHRRYTTGFYFNDEEKNYKEDSMPIQTHEFVAIVTGDTENGYCEVEMRNKFVINEKLEILSKNDEVFNKIIEICDIIDSEGNKIDKAIKVQERVKIKTSLPLSVGDILRRKQ